MRATKNSLNHPHKLSLIIQHNELPVRFLGQLIHLYKSNLPAKMKISEGSNISQDLLTYHLAKKTFGLLLKRHETYIYYSNP